MAKVTEVAEEVVEVYVNMGRIIKNTVKSISFPPVKQLEAKRFGETSSELDEWQERDIKWDAHEFGVEGITWGEIGTYDYIYNSQDTRRKFAFDPERLRVA